MDLRKHLDQQAARTRIPTPAQAKAGNYLKGRVKAHGLPVVIENARGSIRRGVGPNGKAWECRLPAHYGYIRRTEGADGDHVDVYVGPHLNSRKVFVLDQRDADSGAFDEHKAFFGFASPQQVLNVYRKAFSDGKADKRFGHLVQMTPDEFRGWLKDGDTTQPIKRAHGGRIHRDEGGAIPRVYIPTNEVEENARLLPEFDADPRNLFQRVMGEFKPPQPERAEAPADDRSIWQKLTGQFGERYQTWPEKVVRSGATLPGDVLSGEVPQWERDPRTGEYHTSNTMIERAQDTAGMAGGTSFGALDTSAATLGAGPVRRASALPMDEASRMARATEQGYTTDAYHGTRAGDVGELQPSRSGEFGPGVYFTDNPDSAWAWGSREGSEGAGIIPAKLKLENPKTITKQEWLKLNERLTPREIQAKFKKEGHDGIIAIGLNGVDRQIIPFDTSQIRSRFAAFAPANIGKPGLLLEDAAAPGAPLSALEKAPPFFSAVERAVDALPQSKMTGDQWLGTLSNKPGVKPEELQWTGLGDFLAERKGQPVTKAEIAEHLADNQVRLNEVWKGADPATLAKAQELARSHGNAWDDLSQVDQHRYLRRAGDHTLTEAVPGDTKYHQYQLPGGDNYREMLMTLPLKSGAEGAEAAAFARSMHAKYGDRWIGRMTPEESARYDHLIDAQEAVDRTSQPYKSSHWDEPNILAHMRMNDRTIDGKRALHLEEIQSDFMQDHRAQRSKIVEAVDRDFDAIADRMVQAGVIKKVCD